MLKTASEFYVDTLKNSEIARAEPTPIEKTAERLGVSVKVARLAEAYFQQLQLDGVPYLSMDDCKADALKMAQKYAEHEVKERTAAAKVADDAMLALLKVAATISTESKIAGLTPAGVLRLATLQLDAFDDATKSAAWAPERAAGTTALLANSEATKVASMIPEFAAWLGRDVTAVSGAGADALLEA